MLLAKKDMDALNLSRLTQEQTTKLMEIKDNLELTNSGIYDFGTEISENLGNFSTELLNKVKLKDSWYNMDCTWDDSASGIEYTYFCKNDKNINDSAHTPENRYKKYLPPCTLDSGATETSAV